MPFFADTYALIEFLRGRKEYQRYFTENEIITTRMNLMELYYAGLLYQEQEKAEKYFDSSVRYIVEFTDEIN